MCSWRSNSFKKGENSRTKKWSWKKIIQLWNTLGSGKGVPKGSALCWEGVRGTDRSAWIPEASCCPCSHHALFTAFSPADVCEWRTGVWNQQALQNFLLRTRAQTKISLHILVPYSAAQSALCVPFFSFSLLSSTSPFSYFHLLLKESESNGLILS